MTNAMATASVMPASAAATPRQSTHVAAKAATKHPAKAEAKSHALASAAHKPAARDAIKPVKDSGGRDPDVDLLAALMAHVDAKANRSHDRSRIPVDEPSIAKLVKRCEGLSGDEAVQCQKRICDGYWGKAQACPARSEPHRE